MMSNQEEYKETLATIFEHLGDATSYVAEAMNDEKRERILPSVNYAIEELVAANKLLKAWRDELEDE